MENRVDFHGGWELEFVGMGRHLFYDLKLHKAFVI